MFKIETDEKVLPFILKMGQTLKRRGGISPELQKAIALAAVELMPYAIGFLQKQGLKIQGEDPEEEQPRECSTCSGLDIAPEDLPPEGQPFVEPWRWVEERNRWERAPGGVAGGDCWSAWVRVVERADGRNLGASAWVVSGWEDGALDTPDMEHHPAVFTTEGDGSSLLQTTQARVDARLRECGFFVRDPVEIEDPTLFEEVFGFPVGKA